MNITKFKRKELMMLVESEYTKMLIQRGKIKPEIVNGILNIDPTKTKKYTNWVCKMYIQNPFDINDLKSTLEEFDVFLSKGKTKEIKNIEQFKSIEELSKYVEELNNTGTASQSELENDYEIVVNNPKMEIFVPHTHEASRKLGMKYFKQAAKGECSWCTTYKNNNHFNNYYYTHNVTFYYVYVKDEELKKQIKEQIEDVEGRYDLQGGCALVVLDDGRVDGYDLLDKQMSEKAIQTFAKIMGLKLT